MRRLFVRDTSYVTEMVTLHLLGWSSVSLGKKFGKDHTTILHHLRKCGIPADHRRPTYEPTEEEIGAIEIFVQAEPTPIKYAHLLMEKINQGKSYSQYLTQNDLQTHVVEIVVLAD